MKLDMPDWSKGREPTRDYTCPDCGVVFRARGAWVAGRHGKVCPNGHFYPVNHLVQFAKTGTLPGSRSRKSPQVPKPISEAKTVAKALESRGLGERTSQLSCALRWMLEGYQKAIAAMPERSQGRQLVDGAFGQAPAMCRELLDGVEKREPA